MTLTPKQARFVAEYLKDLNATQAAARAGYSAKTANQQGSRLLANVGVAQAIAAGKAKQLESADISATRILEEMKRIALVDVRSFFDEHGNAKAIKDLGPDQGAALGGFEVLIKNAKAGDGVTDTIHKFKLWDKPKVLEMFCKHFGLLEERVQHSGDITISWQAPT
jgi:phage terminase small subunit